VLWHDAGAEELGRTNPSTAPLFKPLSFGHPGSERLGCVFTSLLIRFRDRFPAPRASGTITLISMSELTRLLDAAAAGDRRAAADLLPLVYDELRRLAAARMAAESPGHTLDATALVHEAYLRT
jgi:hypothetical protein